MQQVQVLKMTVLKLMMKTCGDGGGLLWYKYYVY